MRHVVPAAEEILDKPVKLLNHGHVSLLDYMGSDAAICDAARTSISGQGVKKVTEDTGLIRYLLRMKHTTPFEMVVLKFHCKMPIFVARQWIRHRMSSVNEMSGRYGELPEEFYVPETALLQFQDPKNKQGRSGKQLTDELAEYVSESFHGMSLTAFQFYHFLLGKESEWLDREEDQTDEEMQRFLAELRENKGLAKETARNNLPLSTYTQWVWKIDLHNLMHFLRLRMDAHAQYEIRVFANAMAEMVKAVCPIAFEAFEDFVLNAVTFSAQELSVLQAVVSGCSVNAPLIYEKFTTRTDAFKTIREYDEFQIKLGKMIVE